MVCDTCVSVLGVEPPEIVDVGADPEHPDADGATNAGLTQRSSGPDLPREMKAVSNRWRGQSS